MATPKKPGERVMLTETYGEAKHGEIGRVARRNDDLHEPTWNVRLESGALLEIQEEHLSCVTE